MRSAMIGRFGWSIALAASAVLPASPAQARDEQFSVSMPAGNLADTLEALSAQIGISFVYETRLPAVRTHAVRGRLTAREALERMLADAPVRAVRIGERTFRIVARKRPRPASRPAEAPEPSPDAVDREDIIVTARKLPESLSAVAASISVYVPPGSASLEHAADAREVAWSVDGLSLTNAGAGRDRPFIRGLADSPFDGFSQSTVSVQLDDGRVTYDAAEPGLQLVDIARVEILKGPQGPLYGTGALGGVYRIVTNRPVIGATMGEISLGAQQVWSGGAGANVEAMANLPLVADRAALRLVGYARSDGGWIHDDAGGSDLNRTRTLGGRAALRIAPATGWTIDLNGAYQSIRAADSQYVDLEFDDLTRAAMPPEPRRGSFALAQSTISGPVGSLRLTVATSHAWQDQNDVFNAADAAAQLGVPGALRYIDQRSYRVFDQEVRLGSAPGSDFTWTAGASYVLASTHATGAIDTASTRIDGYFDLHRRVTEAAVFADGAYPIAPRLRLALGARLFRATTEDERGEGVETQTSSHGVIGFTPSASLSYQLADDRLVYLRVGSAFRPGGIDPSNATSGRYDGDEVRSVDLGGRAAFDGGRLELAMTAFQANWRHVQSDYLEPNGLVATHNVGDAAVVGVEASASWRLRGGWRLSAGFTAQRPRLVRAADGVDLPVDRRLPVVPDLTGRIALERATRIFGHEFRPHAAINFVGASRLSFDDGLDRRMGSFALARMGASTTLGAFEVALDVDNLLDTRADSFAYGNPFSIRSMQQYTPLRPRTLGMSVSSRF